MNLVFVAVKCGRGWDVDRRQVGTQEELGNEMPRNGRLPSYHEALSECNRLRKHKPFEYRT
jgi:hypothetical protein